MQLFYSVTSPFARKVTIFLNITGLIDQCTLVLTNPFESEELRQRNPLGKVPALIDGDNTITESGLICEYLDHKHTGPSMFMKNQAAYFDIQKIHYLADGILQAAVSSVFETRRETEHSQYWLDRWQVAIQSAIESIKVSSLGSATAPHMGTIAMAAALGYLDFRLNHLPWRDYNPPLAEWFSVIEKQTWFQNTVPTA